MRLGVLDVGSNTVHLLVVDAHPGARPLPAHSHKAELRLAELLDERGAIAPDGVERLIATVRDALLAAEDKGCEEVLPFATSAVREATNADAVLARVKDETGVDLQVLTGEEEARLTFLAARRWFGWSAGKLLLLDIGGGSLEVAYGIDEDPDTAVSLPLGAGRLTSGWLPGDRADADAVKSLRQDVRAQIARTVGEFSRFGRPDHVVATSKTFKQLARIMRRARFGGRPVRPARPVPQVPGGMGPAPRRDDRPRARGPAGRLGRPRPPAPRGRARRRGRDGPARSGGAGDLPVGAARGRDPAPPGPPAGGVTDAGPPRPRPPRPPARAHAHGPA